jgi:hypothetical protein
MELPRRVARERRRLLEPAFAPHDVRALVAVDVAHAQAVHERAELEIGRERVEDPRLRRVRRIGRGPSEARAGVEDELALSVTGQVDERRRLVVDDGRHEVLRPVRCAGTFARIAQPHGLLARELHVEEVHPPVAVEVLGPGEERVRVAVRIERRRRVELVLRLEIRPFVPVRPATTSSSPSRSRSANVAPSQVKSLASCVRRNVIVAGSTRVAPADEHAANSRLAKDTSSPWCALTTRNRRR